MVPIDINQAIYEKQIEITSIDNIYESFPFIYNLQQNEIKDLKQKTQIYLCDEGQTVVQKGDELKDIIFILKGKVGVYSTKQQKVMSIIQSGSLISLEQLYNQTINQKSIISLEKSIIGKIVCDGEDGQILREKVISSMQKFVETIKKCCFLSLISEKNLIKITANSKLKYYVQQDQLKCSQDQFMLVIQGKFQRVVSNQEQEKNSQNMNQGGFPKLKAQFDVKMEFNKGDMISSSNQLEQLKKKQAITEQNKLTEFQQNQTINNQTENQIQNSPQNNTYVNCKSEKGILLCISKQLYLKCTQFYQGLVKKKKINQNIYNQTQSKQFDFIKDKRTEQQEKITPNPSINLNNKLTNVESVQVLLPTFVQQKKPDTQGGRPQNYSVPKVDMDLFTRRSNVSPDQKQEFYECYSSRYYRPENTVKKSILRNYSELTQRKNKSTQIVKPDTSNILSQGKQNEQLIHKQNIQQQIYIQQQNNPIEINSFMNPQENEFQTVLKFNSIPKAKNSSYTLNNNSTLFQNKIMFNLEQSNYSINSISLHAKDYLQDINNIKNNATQDITDKIQFQNMRISQQLQSINSMKKAYIERLNDNIIPNKIQRQQQFHQPIKQGSFQNFQQHLKGQMSQNYVQQTTIQQNEQNTQENLNRSKDTILCFNKSKDIQEQQNFKTKQLFNTAILQRSTCQQVSKSHDFYGSETQIPRNIQNQECNQNQNNQNQYNQSSQNQKTTSQSYLPLQYVNLQYSSIKNRNNSNDKQQQIQLRNRQNSDQTIKYQLKHHVYTENNEFRERKQYNNKTEEEEQTKFSYKLTQNGKDFSKFQDIYDFQNKTATFKKVSLHQEKQAVKINPSTNQIRIYKKQNESPSQINDNNYENSKEDFDSTKQNGQLFTFYNKSLLKSHQL